jgi:cellulose synthase/poly-beta-1,6-N-acetylglucosamine synthase-like glycosyltransferase
MTLLFHIAFWVCLGVVAYAWAVYPFVIWIISRLIGRAPAHRECRSHDGDCAACDAELPTLTLLIAAHDEEAVIGARLENALALDYPREKLQIVVASDGSTDRTAEIVRSFTADPSPLTPHPSPEIRLLDYKPNRGKAATLNAAWREMASELVLLSDANTWIDPAAPRKLVRWFADDEVGAVCGRLTLVDPATGRNVDSVYWRYETFLKQCEARLGALLGANGAIYAIRRTSFVPIPAETIIDDFVIPLLAKLKSGCRLVYDAEAVAHEESPPEICDEFKRRARIGAGGFQSLAVLWPLLGPRYSWLAFSFLSHKLLRWLCPFFLVGMVAANLALLHVPLYCWIMAAQVAFYLVAWAGNSLPRGRSRWIRLVRLTTMFSSMNAALLVGFFRWLLGKQRGTWTRTARSGDIGQPATDLAFRPLGERSHRPTARAEDVGLGANALEARFPVHPVSRSV